MCFLFISIHACSFLSIFFISIQFSSSGGVKEEELPLLQRFFGTLQGQSDLTLQDLADEEDLDLDEEADFPPFSYIFQYVSMKIRPFSLRFPPVSVPKRLAKSRFEAFSWP